MRWKAGGERWKARRQTLLRRLKHLASALHGSTDGLWQTDALGKIQHRAPRGFLCSPKDTPCLHRYVEQHWCRSLLLWQAETCLPATPGTVLAARRTSDRVLLLLSGVAWDVRLLQQHLPAGGRSLSAFRVCTLICLGASRLRHHCIHYTLFTLQRFSSWLWDLEIRMSLCSDAITRLPGTETKA